jgi:hypothetical protein
MNRSKDLRDLFRQSLINERKQSTTTYRSPYYGGSYPSSVHRIPGQYHEGEIQFSKEIRIYFYEWSDVSRQPRCFYQLEAFENFLKSSGIYMQLYQREIIRNLGTVYVACYTGTKNLNFRASYNNLLESMKKHDASKLLSNMTNKTPKVLQSVAHEPEGRWPQNDGTFFG